MEDNPETKKPLSCGDCNPKECTTCTPEEKVACMSKRLALDMKAHTIETYPGLMPTSPEPAM